MFDVIKCEYKLPFPEDLGECKDVDWDEVEFQSKSLDSEWFTGGETYTLTEDGQIYHNKVSREWIEDDASQFGGYLEVKGDGIERLDHTGEINFYHLHMGKKQDYWMEFKTVFYKGELKELTLEEWKEQDNTERIKVKKQMSEILSRARARQKRWWFPFYSFYVTLIRVVFGFFKWVLGKILSFLLWLEQKVI